MFCSAHYHPAEPIAHVRNCRTIVQNSAEPVAGLTAGDFASIVENAQPMPDAAHKATRLFRKRSIRTLQRSQARILVTVHPVLPGTLKHHNSSFLGSDPMESLLKAHT